MKKIYQLCNLNTKVNRGVIPICSFEEFSSIQHNEGDVFLIFVHLNWDGRCLSHFFGFDIAKDLRLKHQSKSPIILYSPLSSIFFENQRSNDVKFNILYAPGTYFLDTKSNWSQIIDQITKYNPISKECLVDINQMLLNLQGVILDKINHDLKIHKDIRLILDYIFAYLPSDIRESISFVKYSDLFYRLQKENKNQEFEVHKEEWIRLIKRYVKSESIQTDLELDYKPKLLILDDVQEEIFRLSEILKDNYEIISTTKSCDAINILTADIENQIIVVIVDWRLFDPVKPRFWQTYQGYDVLMHSYSTGYRALFSLTSQDESIVNAIRAISPFNFKLFPKNYVENTQDWNLMKSIIAQEVVEITNHIASIPASKGWEDNTRGIEASDIERLKSKGRTIIEKVKGKKQSYLVEFNSLKNQYLFVKNTNHKIFFEEIYTKADLFWKYYSTFIENEILFSSQSIKQKFDHSLPHDKDLASVFPVRLVYFALFIYLKEKNYNLPCITRKQESVKLKIEEICFYILNGYDHTIDKLVNSNVFKTNLSIDIQQIIDQKFLPEEKFWLLKHKIIF